MNLQANIQTRIYGLDRFIFELINIYKKTNYQTKFYLLGKRLWKINLSISFYKLRSFTR